MMKKLYVFLFCALSLCANAQKANMDSLYNCLDDAINHIDDYIAIREKRISELRTHLNSARDDESRYDIMFSLYKEYQSYSNDSAVAYISDCIDMARKMGAPHKEALCRVRLAYQCSSAGYYTEAFDILEAIDTTTLDHPGMGEYYVAYFHVYSEVGYYTQVKSMQREYYAKAEEYRHKIMNVLSEDDDAYLQRMEMDYFNSGDVAKALEVNDKRMRRLSPDSREFAIVAFYRFLDSSKAGDDEGVQYWLVRSAISDVRHAVMDQGAMWELANILSEDKNELERSYRYICFANECADRFGARLRHIQISSVFPTIDKLYQAFKDKRTNQLRILLGVTTFLAVLILVLFFYVNRQRRLLMMAKKELSDKNKELSDANDQLSELTGKLYSLNNSLAEANVNLHDSNMVKDKYIGRFLRLCSMYIDNMDGLRKRVGKFIKSRDYDALGRFLKEQETKDKELNMLYGDFDTAFLHLYPDFVKDFNALLREEERIVLADDGVLNTPLRIFALIRLGVDDSSKIAGFLHYSVNTIYNYRARIKNGALGDRDTFEERVKMIGKVKSPECQPL